MKIDILINQNLNKRDLILSHITQHAVNMGLVNKEHKDKVVQAFFAREMQTSTAFENGFAIPHAASEFIKYPAIIYYRNNIGVDWKSLDKKPTKYITALLIPKNQQNSDHINILSKIATALLDESFQNTLINSQTKEPILFAFKAKMVKSVEASNNLNSSGKKIVALTACPVGVAHTYIAAEKLKEAAIKLGHQVKVETHGSAWN